MEAVSGKLNFLMRKLKPELFGKLVSLGDPQGKKEKN